MKQPNVVFVGHVCIDHNVSEHATYTNWGSGTLYMASFAEKQLALPTTVLSTYGTDFAPYAAAFHILPSTPQHMQTLIYKNVTAARGRTQHCQNVEVAEPPKLDTVMKRTLAQADIVVLATLLPNYSPTYVRELLSYVPANSLKVCCPQGYFRHVDLNGVVSSRKFTEATQLLPLFDLTLLSEEDCPNAFEQAAEWRTAPSMSDVIVTEGPRGASIISSDGRQHIPTKPIAEENVIDSVGCGDIFAMATALRFYQTRDLAAAVRHAHQAARAKLLQPAIDPASSSLAM